MSKFETVCVCGALASLWVGVLICDRNIHVIHETQNEIIDEITKLQNHARATTAGFNYLYEHVDKLEERSSNQ